MATSIQRMVLIAFAKELWNDFICNLFPEICLNCKTTLVRDEQYICSKCKVTLPKTNLHQVAENRLYQKFAFEPKVKFVSAYLDYNRMGIARRLIHQLKYKNSPELGELLGAWYGTDLLASPIKPDVIVPVPLHKRKLKSRGFNQSESIAQGLSASLGAPVDTDLVVRNIYTNTQTRKSKINRWRNVDSIFSVREGAKLTGKRVLLVDDVLTTGATLGSVAALLVSHQVDEIYIVTIAAGA